MGTISLKSEVDIKLMRASGKIAGRVLRELISNVKVGISTFELDQLAEDLMSKAGVMASFKTVEDYQFSTCININNGIVHGLPSKGIILKAGDIVKIDLGVIKDGWHSDVASSIYLQTGNVEIDKPITEFLDCGRQALNKSIDQCRSGKRLLDISRVIEDAIEIRGGYKVVYELTGHGIGKELHEAPDVPGVMLLGPNPKLEVGMTLAVEVIYSQTGGEMEISNDGWTINTKDGSLAGLFEETVAITKSGPLILTSAI